EEAATYLSRCAISPETLQAPNSRSLRPLTLPRRNCTILSGSSHSSHSASVISFSAFVRQGIDSLTRHGGVCSLLAEDQIHHPAAPHMGAWTPAVVKEFPARTPRLFKSI